MFDRRSLFGTLAVLGLGTEQSVYQRLQVVTLNGESHEAIVRFKPSQVKNYADLLKGFCATGVTTVLSEEAKVTTGAVGLGELPELLASWQNVDDDEG